MRGRGREILTEGEKGKNKNPKGNLRTREMWLYSKDEEKIFGEEEKGGGTLQGSRVEENDREREGGPVFELCNVRKRRKMALAVNGHSSNLYFTAT